MKGVVFTQRFSIKSGILAPKQKAIDEMVQEYSKPHNPDITNSTFRHAGDLLVAIHNPSYTRRMTLSHDGQVRFEDFWYRADYTLIADRFVRNYQVLDIIARDADSKFKDDVTIQISGDDEAVKQAYLTLLGHGNFIGELVARKIPDLYLRVPVKGGARIPTEKGNIAIVTAEFNPDYTCEPAGVQ